MFKCQLLFLELSLDAEVERALWLCQDFVCVYFYMLELNESAANKLYQGLTVKPSLNKQDIEYSDAAVL